ncbi:hypothetical protein AAA799D07_00197 [Marine Group I thaumarchaeote SCGC AAA799-D07]|nr:hypothetical protein AAA799D07_00197 [Marine Group I thaumarchaeote SCGC AAA799-D07]
MLNLLIMGLLHTMHYLDFPSNDWKQISINPTIFEVINDNAVLVIYDISHKEQNLRFKKGSRIKCIRSVGKYRLTWNDEDLI